MIMKKYVSPHISVQVIYIEESIASGSAATINAVSSQENYMESEWDKQVFTQEFEWN